MDAIDNAGHILLVIKISGLGMKNLFFCFIQTKAK